MKNSNILEADVEDRLVRKVKKLGGRAYKFTSPARRSVPDRIVFFNGHCILVELKRPKKTWTDLQARERDKLQLLGMIVLLISTYDEVDEFIDFIKILT